MMKCVPSKEKPGLRFFSLKQQRGKSRQQDALFSSKRQSILRLDLRLQGTQECARSGRHTARRRVRILAKSFAPAKKEIQWARAIIPAATRKQENQKRKNQRSPQHLIQMPENPRLPLPAKR